MKWILALSIAAGFFILNLVAIGINIHAWFEIRDSIEFWEREAAAFDPEAPRPFGQETPGARLQRLRERKTRIEESFVAPIAVATCFGVLLAFSWRAYRSGRIRLRD